jgi:hypothetical protein
MPLVDKKLMKLILDDFNAQGTLEQIEDANEIEHKKKMVQLHKDPSMIKLWAEAKEDVRKIEDD